MDFTTPIIYFSNFDPGKLVNLHNFKTAIARSSLKRYSNINAIFFFYCQRYFLKAGLSESFFNAELY